MKTYMDAAGVRSIKRHIWRRNRIAANRCLQCPNDTDGQVHCPDCRAKYKQRRDAKKAAQGMEAAR